MHARCAARKLEDICETCCGLGDIFENGVFFETFPYVHIAFEPNLFFKIFQIYSTKKFELRCGKGGLSCEFFTLICKDRGQRGLNFYAVNELFWRSTSTVFSPMISSTLLCMLQIYFFKNLKFNFSETKSYFFHREKYKCFQIPKLVFKRN